MQLPQSIRELWRLFSVINVKVHYASEPSPGYLDITREFRTPACPPEEFPCVPGKNYNATPFIIQCLSDLLSDCQTPYRGVPIEGSRVYIANRSSSVSEGSYFIKVEVQAALAVSLDT